MKLNWTLSQDAVSQLYEHILVLLHPNIPKSCGAKMQRGIKAPEEGTRPNQPHVSFVSQPVPTVMAQGDSSTHLHAQGPSCKFGCLPEPALPCADTRAVWAPDLDSFCSNCSCSCHTQHFCTHQIQTACINAQSSASASCIPSSRGQTLYQSQGQAVPN